MQKLHASLSYALLSTFAFTNSFLPRGDYEPLGMRARCPSVTSRHLAKRLILPLSCFRCSAQKLLAAFLRVL